MQNDRDDYLELLLLSLQNDLEVTTDSIVVYLVHKGVEITSEMRKDIKGTVKELVLRSAKSFFKVKTKNDMDYIDEWFSFV